MVPRMTLTTQAVLQTLLERPTQVTYGLVIVAATGLRSGTVHPILARLEGVGWIESDWEDIDPAEMGRPRRRYYRLTGDGLVAARHALANAQSTRIRLTGGPQIATDTP